MTEWATEFFRRADALDAAGVSELLSDDVVLIFGNWDEQTGRETVHETFAGFYDTIAGMSHAVRNLWKVPGGAIVESNVTYEKPDSTSVSIPATTILSRSSGKIDGIRIYIDVSPLS